ncbi:MAG: 1,2-phenylacetyl-CoA epoxidase subunit PaaD [Ginsengibacter sp.]
MENVKDHSSAGEVWRLLMKITDPEIPVLSITDLGIIREIKISDTGIEIFITPTYSGCPAMDVISMNIRMALLSEGFTSFTIIQQLSPAWTTDWMTNEGKEKLRSYGIAPPVAKTFDKNYSANPFVQCPLCNSTNTALISQFGSTSCKALYKCNECLEPFDYFKCH